MIPLYEINGHSTSPMGMPMCQNRLAVPTWSYAMEVLPPARIVEIGSYNGALATALGLHARVIGAKVVTYDINAQSESIVPIGLALGVDFRVGSCWDRQVEIGELITSPGVSFVLCDGGDKPRELETFARYCKPGDVIAAHDFDMYGDTPEEMAPPQLQRPWPWSEVRARDGRRIAEAHGLSPWMQNYFDLAGWLVYRKA